MRLALRFSYFWLILNLCSFQIYAQGTQNISGKIVDKDSKTPLVGVAIVITTPNVTQMGTTSDANGRFKLENVPLGRHNLMVRYLGYKEIVLNNIVVDAGKEVVLNLEMSESINTIKEVEITAERNGEVNNVMATASARQFSVEETDRYAGSRGEPSRMASNFAGVQGADDSRNDIIIRGNSPSGVLWRLEGISIPNPNHFNIPGTAGGSISIINNRYLANSDFFTGAFPSEFANSTAGVFDLKMRNGNQNKHEFMVQFGFLGTEAMAEGPLNKETGATYLATYRYGNTWLFDRIGIDIGTEAVPFYQDGFLRLNFPQKNGANLSLWALGGTSTIDILISDQDATDRNIFGQNDRDQYFTSNMFTSGITYSKSLSKNTFFKSTLAVSNSAIIANHQYLFLQKDTANNPIVENNRFVIDSIRPILDYKFRETKVSWSNTATHKLSSRSTLKFGMLVEFVSFNAFDSVRFIQPNQTQFSPWTARWDANKSFANFQPFIQWRYAVSEVLEATAGINTFVSTINKNSASWVEPRVGLAYELPKAQKLTFAAGLHSQQLPTYLYYYNPNINQGIETPYNEAIGLTKSLHSVLGYSKMLAPNLKLLAEVYHQYLFKIPVEQRISSFSMVNAGSGFSRLFPDTLQNTGTGKNYGFELTLEKFFSKNYYFLVTTSLFDAKYRGSDGVLRNTDFNGRYALNVLFAKEFKVGKQNKLNLGAKFTTVGGRWFGPVDIVQSQALQEVVFENDLRNTQQFAAYKRFDLKIDYKINKKQLTHTIAVDLVNIFGIENILGYTYVPQAPYVQEQFQLGFLPVFFYRVDF